MKILFEKYSKLPVNRFGLNHIPTFLVGIVIMFFASQFGYSQINIDKSNFEIFDSNGKAVSFEDVIDKFDKAEVIFLGEMHDDAVAHFLQAKIFERAVEKFSVKKNVVLSLEMFERDVQIILDEYLSGLISEKKFLDDSRPWKNYQMDYRPLVELAKSRKLAVIAANAPRRYVNMVSRGGRETILKLSSQAKSWLAPLPYAEASPAYTNKFKSLMGNSMEAKMGLDNILSSQSLWDATMADSIARVLNKDNNSLVIHLNGAFHTENRLGTVEHLLHYKPNAKVLVITMRYEDDFRNFNPQKHTGLGDFVILTDSKIPRSGK